MGPFYHQELSSMADPPEHPDEVADTSLLKQFGDNISRFADQASAEEKRSLVKMLDKYQLLELLQTWRYRDRRKSFRKPCSLPVSYTVEGQVFTDVISNISMGGAFIATSSILSLGTVGQQVTLMISPPNRREPIMADCEIAWTDPGRVGLKFIEVTKALREIIETL
jgi:hypothetical protein